MPERKRLPVMYAILRKDLNLPPLKAAAKLGQAFINAFNKATPETKQLYLADGEGTQIVLTANSQEELLHLHAEFTGHDYPTSIVIEDGKLVAVGVGPVDRKRVRHLTGGLPLC
jgi:peptidyl-tRNA hydrolase